MAKLTKQQKRGRKKRKNKEYRKRKRLRLKNKPRPWEAVKMKMFQMPSIFPAETPREKRLEILRDIGATAKKDFDEKYPTIQKWFEDYDPLYILSFCAFYFCCYPAGTDPEATDGSLEFYPYYLEIMQAFALFQKRNCSSKPLLNDAKKLQQEMKEIGRLMQLRLFDIPESLNSHEEIETYKLRMDMAIYTSAVRNWAYPQQIEKVVKDLSGLIKSEFEIRYGIDPAKLMRMLFEIIEDRNDLLREHITKVRSLKKSKDYKEMIESYNQAFPENDRIEGEEIKRTWNYVGKNIKNLFHMLICHSDLKLEKVFTFDIDHAVSLYGENTKRKELVAILDKFSYKFGDLQGYEKEYIIFDNPIHHRPFIKIADDKYYSAIFGALHHLSLGLLEDIIAEDDGLRKEYNDRLKPKYLENEVERLFRLNFPNAHIFRGSQWIDSSNNTQYENDLLVVIDTFAIIVEAKSGSVTPPAKRGAPKRLFETLKALIEEPSEQAHRFMTYLKNNKIVHTFTNKRGENNVVDTTKINYFIPLGITLSDLGAISSNLKKLIDAGITEKRIGDFAPSISLTTLEVIFELLPLEAEKIHYFARRREIEDHVDYEGDEGDLLAMYLDSGFNWGELEYNGKTAMNLSMKSKELDPYFVGIDKGVNVPKPELTMTNWWKDILNRLAVKKPQNWLETSFILLNMSNEDQEKFQNACKELSRRVKIGKVPKKHNWCVFLSGPEQRRFFIAGYPYITQDKEERNNMISTIINSEETKTCKGVVVIGFNVNRNDYPYTILAGKLETDLFDKLQTANDIQTMPKT